MMVGSLLISGCASGRKQQEEAPVKAVEQVAETQPKVRKVAKRRPIVVKPREEARSETGLPRPFVPQMPGRRVAQVSVPGPYVALTFDDGPSAANTPKVLDILKRHGAKATFFVVGQCAVRHKEILARAVAEGHEVAAHTWSHIKMTGSSDETIISEMDRTNAVITEATGHRPRLMRPPYGATNSHVMDLMMSRYGMASVMWSVDTQDWKHPGVGVVIDRSVNNARSGSIILLHDIHASTLAAVEGVVTGLQRRGFKLVTVSELIELGKNAARDAGVDVPQAAPAAVAESTAPVAAPEVTVGTTAVSVVPTPEADRVAPVAEDVTQHEQPAAATAAAAMETTGAQEVARSTEAL